jgi:cell division protein ZapA
LTKNAAALLYRPKKYYNRLSIYGYGGIGTVNRMTVQIYGGKYNITTTEDVAYVRGLAAELDGLVTNLMNSGGASVDRALLLAALHYMDTARKSDEGADNLRRQITEYADEAAKARTELAEVRRELSRARAGGNEARLNV